jgi:hypothetical protein
MKFAPQHLAGTARCAVTAHTVRGIFAVDWPIFAVEHRTTHIPPGIRAVMAQRAVPTNRKSAIANRQ